jgi:hypothetical protein
MSVLAIPAVSTPAYKERTSAAWLFVLVDAVALELSLLLGVLVRQFLPIHAVEISPSQYKGVAFGLLMIPLAYYLAGLYPDMAGATSSDCETASTRPRSHSRF